MTLCLDTYLHLFCLPWGDGARYQTYSPWIKGGWKGATDSRVFLAIPTVEPDDEGNADVRLPALRSYIQECLGLWLNAKPWPSLSRNMIIEPDDEEDDLYSAVVLDWDSELVIDARYYWLVERLAIAFDRRVEYRVASDRGAACFRSTDSGDLGLPLFVGQVMPLDWQRMPSVEAAILLHRESTKEAVQ